MKTVDVAVIGGGVLGCFAARNLTKFRLSVVLVEAAEDVCTGVTRANSAVVYPGCDNRFEETEAGKGVTAVPCTEGNLLLDSPPRPYAPDFATTREGLHTIRAHGARLLPALDFGAVIRSFGGVRPNPEGVDGRDIRDFCIQRPAPAFWSLVGVKTPGLTCADELGALVAGECAAALGTERNEDFHPERRAIRPAPGSPLICRCEGVSRDAVVEAIRRGAVTVDGVKRRVGAGMGRCQGARCAYEIEQLLKEYGHGGTV